MKAALTDATECMALIKALDALRRDEPFEGFCDSLSALEQQTPEATAAITLLSNARDAAQRIKAADFAKEGITGPALGAAIQAAQIEQISVVLAGVKGAL
jgi:tRNA nucleotidyltransferase (CCA-adding enzyme)